MSLHTLSAAIAEKKAALDAHLIDAAHGSVSAIAAFARLVASLACACASAGNANNKAPKTSARMLDPFV